MGLRPRPRSLLKKAGENFMFALWKLSESFLTQAAHQRDIELAHVKAGDVLPV